MRGAGRLVGKTAIVTGGGGGLGRAQCIRLAEEGAAVAVWDVNRSTGEATATHITEMILRENLDSKGVRFDEVDVTNEEDIATTMENIASQFGGVDIMVNNHAHFIFKTNDEATS